MLCPSFTCLYASVFFAMAVPAPKAKAQNPLLLPWSGSYGGVPPFNKVNVKDFKPALEDAIQECRTEMKAISDNPQPPTFENTFLAMERAGETLSRVSAIYGVWSANQSSPEFQAIEQEMEPKLAAFRDEIIQDSKLFKRIETVYQSPQKNKLTPEQQRLVWYQYTRFALQGAQLDDAQKKKVADINQKLAALYTQFSQHLLGDEEKDFFLIEKKADLAGLPQSFIDAAGAEGEKRNLKGKWVVSNTRSSMEVFLTYSSKRDLREQAFRIWTSRGDNNNANNNNKLISEILSLRLERSKILGFKTYAHWHLADSMAKDPQAAMDLMLKVWKPANARVKQEVADMQAIVDSEKGNFKIQPWDYRYYAEKVRKAKYDLDLDAVKPYLQLENLREAMFWVAGQLYGFKFAKISGVPVFHPKVTVYKVSDEQGKLVGLWYFDPYARAGKRSGAWMTSYREQKKIDGVAVQTIVSNNSNFIEGKPGEPVLISWDDANTMFHEFGHALHGLNSNVTYPSLSGTNTARDFVEFPSQINENWLSTQEVLNFLKDKKGNTLPKALIEKIEKAKTFNQGFMTTEFLASAIVDMKLHLSTDTQIDTQRFEKDTLAALGMPSEIVMRHRIPQFGHLFSGEEYAAGYYGYLWAEVLDHDAFDAFKEGKGPYDKAVAKKLKDTIMSVGNTVDPSQAFRNFRGRDPKVEALLKARGF